jgi:hypothetical protein
MHDKKELQKVKLRGPAGQLSRFCASLDRTASSKLTRASLSRSRAVSTHDSDQPRLGLKSFENNTLQSVIVFIILPF